MGEYELEQIGSYSPDRVSKSQDEKVVSFLSGLTLFAFRCGKEQSIQMTEKPIDFALSNELVFCLLTTGKILVLDNTDLQHVYTIDLAEENEVFSSLSISNDHLILRNANFADVKTFQGETKLRINCSEQSDIFLFEQDVVVLIEEADFSVSVTLRHMKQVHQASFDGRIRQVFSDHTSTSILILFDHGGLYQIDCRHLSPLQKFEIPFKPASPIENVQFSESTNLLIFQVIPIYPLHVQVPVLAQNLRHNLVSRHLWKLLNSRNRPSSAALFRQPSADPL